MGCSQSAPAPQLPASVPPLWKKSGNDLQVPVKFKIGRHTKAYIKQTLETQVGDQILSLTTGSPLVLQVQGDDKILAICKAAGKTFRIFYPQPLYPDQQSGAKYKGKEFYLYATVSAEGELIFVHKPKTPAFEIHVGPRNSFEKFLIEKMHCCFAMWKYNSKDQLHQVEIKDADVDVGLVVFLVVIADLREADAVMNKLGKSVAQASLITATTGFSIAV